MPFGYAWNDLIMYHTTKYMSIRHVGLGLLRYVGIIASLAYILIYKVLYEGGHLKEFTIIGTNQMSMQAPSKGIPHCYNYHLAPTCESDFRDVSELNYCRLVNDTRNLSNLSQKDMHKCSYLDAKDVVRYPDEGILLPTRIRRYRQKRKCRHGNETLCAGPNYVFLNEKGEEQKEAYKRSIAEPIEDVYVADAEHFLLTIAHSYQVPYATQKMEYSYGSHESMDGSWCENSVEHDDTDDIGPSSDNCKLHKLLCVGDVCGRKGDLRLTDLIDGHKELKIPRLDGKGGNKVRSTTFNVDDLGGPTADERKLEQESFKDSQKYPIVSHRYGDVFRMDTLLKLAGVDLDNEGQSARAHTQFGQAQASVRGRGVTLIIRIEYSNLRIPWIGLYERPGSQVKPSYVYYVMRADKEMYKMEETPDSHLHQDDEERDLYKYNGVRVIVQQVGKVCVWSYFNFFLSVVSSIGLITLVNYSLDTILSFMPGWMDILYDKKDPPAAKLDDCNEVALAQEA